MKTTRKLWIGIGAFVLAGNDAPTVPAAQAAVFTAEPPPARALKPYVDNHTRSAVRLAQAFTSGAGGEAGEGGEGGEAGINVETAAKDPLEYGIALQVIAAHYHAGLAAYAAGEREAGAQMFAHGLSEVYVEMEEVFKSLGVKGLGGRLDAAVAAANAKKPAAEVRRKVREVYAALKAAEKRAPKSPLSARAVRAQVAAEMVERAAAQFAASRKDDSLEPYLDGLGFAIAAREQSKDILPWLRKIDPRKAKALARGVTLAAQAYPGIKRPDQSKVALSDFLAAASGTKLAVSSLK
jgi:hypothetical protein